MAALATLFVEPRATERFVAKLVSMLHRSGATPTELLIENLSLTGFSAPAVSGVRLSDVVGIELPHLSTRDAKVIRAAHDRIGCEFLVALSEAELIRALEPSTPKPAKRSPIAADDLAYAEPVVVPFARWVRGTLAITLAVASWAGVIGLLKLV
jgi:hypothetical protein